MTTATANAGAIAGIDLSAYLTTDAARSIAFYTDVLGLAVTDLDSEGRGAEFVLADGQAFGVWNTGKGATGPVVMFGVADMDAALSRIRAAGGTISDAEVLSECSMAFATDPDGNEFIIHHRHHQAPGNPPSAATSGDPADIVGLDLSGYATKDAARAADFYRRVVGIDASDVDKEARGAEFRLADGTYFGVWNGGDEYAYSGGVMFVVGDVDAAVARIRARGAEISDPMDSPVCRMAFGKDPDGNDYIVHRQK